MKKLLLSALIVGVVVSPLASAGGNRYNYNYNYNSNNNWNYGAAALGGALIGGLIGSALNQPRYSPPPAYYPPPVYVVPQQPYYPAPVYVVPQQRCEVRPWQDQYGSWHQTTFCFNP